MLSLAPRVRAVLTVTALATAAGALLGFLAISAVIGIALVAGRALTGRDVIGLLALGTLWGAVFGLALGPLTAFGLLRAVPLWRAILGTALGTVVGIFVTWAFGLNPFHIIPIAFLLGALATRAFHARVAALEHTSGSGRANRKGQESRRL